MFSKITQVRYSICYEAEFGTDAPLNRFNRLSKFRIFLEIGSFLQKIVDKIYISMKRLTYIAIFRDEALEPIWTNLKKISVPVQILFHSYQEKHLHSLETIFFIQLCIIITRPMQNISLISYLKILLTKEKSAKKHIHKLCITMRATYNTLFSQLVHNHKKGPCRISAWVSKDFLGKRKKGNNE